MNMQMSVSFLKLLIGQLWQSKPLIGSLPRNMSEIAQNLARCLPHIITNTLLCNGNLMIGPVTKNAN